MSKVGVVPVLALNVQLNIGMEGEDTAPLLSAKIFGSSIFLIFSQRVGFTWKRPKKGFSSPFWRFVLATRLVLYTEFKPSEIQHTGGTLVKLNKISIFLKFWFSRNRPKTPFLADSMWNLIAVKKLGKSKTQKFLRTKVAPCPHLPPLWPRGGLGG